VQLFDALAAIPKLTAADRPFWAMLAASSPGSTPFPHIRADRSTARWLERSGFGRTRSGRLLPRGSVGDVRMMAGAISRTLSS